MTTLDLDGYNVAAGDETVRMSGSVLELALALFQYNLLTGDSVEGIWNEMTFELHRSGDTNVVLAPRETFERLQAMFDDPEVQKRITKNMENLMKESPIEE
jgi:hypothetical protein